MAVFKIAFDEFVSCITRSKGLAEDIQRAYRNACQLRLTLSGPYNQADDHETLLKKVERDIDEAYELVGKCLLWLSLTKQDFMDTDEQVSYGWVFKGERRGGNDVGDSGGGKESPLKMGAATTKLSEFAGESKKWDGFTGEEIEDDSDGISQKVTLAEVDLISGEMRYAEAEDDFTVDEGDYYLRADYALLETMAGYEAAAGAYIKDGKKVMGAHIGACYSFAIARISEEVRVGDEDLNAYLKAQIEVLKMEASAEAEVSTDGIKLAGEAGLYLAEITGEYGFSALGIDAAVEASLKVGVGVEFDFEIDRDGSMKFEIGAALGLGAELTLDIDASGAIEAACDFGESVLAAGGEVLELTGAALNPFNVKTMHYPGGDFVGGFNDKHFVRPEVMNRGGIGGRF